MGDKAIPFHGVDADRFTRCRHYDSERDIIAIKFRCCGKYFCCYECHSELADHRAEVWRRETFEEKAVLCGFCREELTIQEYLSSQSVCPNCRAAFNPGCENHHHLYFAK